MIVVITGGAGFIGSNLVHHWRRARPDDAVRVYDLLTYAGHADSLADLAGDPKFSFLEGDIGDPAGAFAAVQGADLVVHLAAETHNDRGIVDPIPFVRTNVLGVAQLLEACRRADVPRFHHVSTDEVFGSLALDGGQGFTERSPYMPRGPYSASKAGADHLVRAWGETYGLPFTISNCGNNFGPHQHPEKLIPLAITRLLRGGKVPLYGDGRHVRDWVYVADHCRALERIATAGTLGVTYLVSSGTELANRQVIDRLLRIMGKTEDAIEYVNDRPGHDRRYALDSTRLRTELGWSPSVEFDTALEETVDWYRSNETWWAPLLPPSGVRSR